MLIRSTTLADVTGIARLCEQLGYPNDPVATRRRFEQLIGRQEHAVFVAEHPQSGLVGWVHVRCLPKV